MEFRRLPRGSARQIIDFSNVMAQAEEPPAIICINPGLLDIVLYLLSSRGLWRTTYAMAYAASGSGYYIPTEAEFDPLREKIAEFLEEPIDMSCELNTALEQIVEKLDAANVLAANCCPGGGGSAGAGDYEAPPTGYTDDGENPPPGFDDYSQYDTYKCKAANWLVDAMIADVTLLLNMPFAEIATGLLVGTLVTPVPFDDVAGLVVFVVSIVGETLLDTMLNAILDAIDNYREELVCLIYNAIDEIELINDLLAWIEGKVDALSATFLGYLFKTDAARWVFEKIAQVNILGGPYTCDCDTCPLVTLVDGSIIGIDGDQYDIGAVSRDGYYWLIVHFNQGDDELACGPAPQVSWESTAGSVIPAPNQIRISNDEFLGATGAGIPPWDIMLDAVPAYPYVFTGRTFYLRSSVTFNLVIVVTEV